MINFIGIQEGKKYIIFYYKKEYEAKRNEHEIEQVIKPEITSEYKAVLVRKLCNQKTRNTTIYPRTVVNSA